MCVCSNLLSSKSSTSHNTRSSQLANSSWGEGERERRISRVAPAQMHARAVNGRMVHINIIYVEQNRSRAFYVYIYNSHCGKDTCNKNEWIESKVKTIERPCPVHAKCVCGLLSIVHTESAQVLWRTEVTYIHALTAPIYNIHIYTQVDSVT